MGQYLNSEHHVSRYIKKRLVMWDEDGRAYGIYPQAFELREDEESLSVSWLEYFNRTHEQNIVDSIKEFKGRPFDVHPKSGFGISNVGVLYKICSDSDHPKVKVLYDGDKNKTKKSSHSSIRYTSNDNDLLQNLATKAFSNLVIAEEISPLEK
ncbi:hypothetical protein KJY73_20740 [Bowmanella sp. Y26]|uniref:hypothetical protein n=1 Tax=Bowmanella yangjiangensis TaxID=2811230 RepID=UPI001BDBE2DB|nr:hypothetical protein [Bowmanella yangjiangensis]MBT1066014.1 hypothetical protein [Bowmanella yangjiangensis]